MLQEGYYLRGTLEVGRQATALSSVDVITRMLAGDIVPETIIVPSGQMVTAQNIN